VLRDLEMVQFHPTALDIHLDPMPLVSEAVRGEGAILVNELGQWVLRNPLSARDVVSRAEWAQLQDGHRVFLDARTEPGERFADLFPSIAATAAAAGLDPAHDLLPVRPAAHYHMGGVLVDAKGESTVPGLFAAGEVASTGLHGANRLASNSLLEAVVCGRAVARHLTRTAPRASAPPEPRNWPQTPTLRGPDPVIQQIRDVVTQSVGVLRDEAGLHEGLDLLRPHRDRDAGLVGYLVAWSALRRTESRGAHTRTDFPQTAPYGRHTLVSEHDLAAVSVR
jgi:L-aspartate oxidase